MTTFTASCRGDHPALGVVDNGAAGGRVRNISSSVALPEEPMQHYQRVVCGWCRKLLGSKPANEPGETTSICANCLEMNYPSDDPYDVSDMIVGLNQNRNQPGERT